jgi:hypothetical protein
MARYEPRQRFVIGISGRHGFMRVKVTLNFVCANGFANLSEIASQGTMLTSQCRGVDSKIMFGNVMTESSKG